MDTCAEGAAIGLMSTNHNTPNSVEQGRPPRLRATDVVVTDSHLVVFLEDGRGISVPLSWFPRLEQGTSEQRQNWRFIADRRGISWEDLDEDLSIRGLLSETANRCS